MINLAPFYLFLILSLVRFSFLWQYAKICESLLLVGLHKKARRVFSVIKLSFIAMKLSQNLFAILGSLTKMIKESRLMGVSNLWIIDAADIKSKEDIPNETLVKSRSIDSFIFGDNIRIITATKGFGKTYALKMKSIRIRHEKTGAVYVPKRALVDQFRDNQRPDISKSIIQEYRDENEHKKLWSTVFFIVIIKNTHLITKVTALYEKYPFLKNIINNDLSTTVSGIYKNLLKDYKLFREFHDTNAYGQIESLCDEHLNTPIYMFMDNVDEFYQKLYEETFDHSLWMISQVSLVKAIYDVCKLNHVNIYSTIRKKAIDRISQDPNDTMSQQYNGIVQELQYSKGELQKMFENNIKQEKSDILVDASIKNKNPIKSFFGCETISNEHLNINEKIFDYMFRHTFERPRDLMEMGKNLASYDKLERNNNIRRLINKTAGKIGQSYINEINKFFPEIEFKKLYKMIDKNILTKKNIEDICCLYNNYNEDCDKYDTHIFCALYSQGLIGYERYDTADAHTIIDFITPGAMPIYDYESKLPDSSNYYIQPCFSENISEYRDREFKLGFHSSSKQLVARNTVLKEEITVKKKVNNRLHIHFGAGNLGIGLTIETFLNNKIIIVQRPNKNTEMIKSEYISFIATNFDKTFLDNVKVINDHILEDDILSNENILLISNQVEEIQKILSYADSISSALGPSGMKSIVQYFQHLKLDKKINFYPFENDTHSVDTFFDLVNESNLIRIGVMADRICTDIEYKANEVNLFVEERNYESVIEKKNDNVLLDIVKSTTTKIVASDKFQFYKDRKFAVVNGTHTLLSILAYKKLQDISWSLSDAENAPVDLILNTNVKELLDDFIKLQILRVFLDYHNDVDIEENKFIYDDLLKYGNTVYERLVESAKTDKLGRILNLRDYDKRVNKIVDRLLPVFDTIFKEREKLKELLKYFDESDSIEDLAETALQLNKDFILSMLKEIKDKNTKLKHKIVLDRYDAIIFDMDGLLIDSEKLAYQVLCKKCEDYGIQKPDYINYIQCIGVTKEYRNQKLWNIYIDSITEDKFNELITSWDDEYKNEILTNTTIKKGVYKMLEFIKDENNNIKIGLATSTNTETAKAILQKIGIFNNFDNIVGGDLVEKSKPAPDIYIKVSEELSVSPYRCLVFEDSKHGVNAAYKADMDVVHIEDFIDLSLDKEVQSKIITSFKSLEEVYTNIIL